MKGIYLIAIAFLAPWTVTAIQNVTLIETLDVTCPIVDTCPPTLFFHENNCASYYECKNGYPQLRQCASNLYFSKKWQGCVSFSISECPRKECWNGELSAHECQCTKFYECRHGWKALRECPKGWHFSKTKLSCIEGTDCNGNGVNTCKEDTMTSHECQCDKYYICKNGRQALRTCPRGMKFDSILKICIEGSCTSGIDDMCEKGKKKKHECDCDKYYLCTGQDWLVKKCENGYHYSETHLRCLPPREADCDKTIIKPGTCKNISYRWAHECDCRLYYTCENEQKMINSCPWGYYFDQAALNCNPAKNVKRCKNNWDDWL